ncbi:MAG: hypothetical protein mread185_000564 [Mycoplasmataceae bacterium]|nr:MAG: hypothetical protein mread185_000564 [Mycoplasmataceae bacterium]
MFIKIMNLTQTIQDIIKIKKTRQGSNGKDYLILELTQGESIFVFHNSDTPESQWAELVEGNEYLFTVKEGNRIGSNVLIYFEKVDFIV